MIKKELWGIVAILGGILYGGLMGAGIYAQIASPQVAYAASVSKQQQPGCEVVGKVGNWNVSHCFDGYGHEFIANDAGFIAPLPN
jgi:hypothetical protein